MCPAPAKAFARLASSNLLRLRGFSAGLPPDSTTPPLEESRDGAGEDESMGDVRDAAPETTEGLPLPARENPEPPKGTNFDDFSAGDAAVAAVSGAAAAGFPLLPSITSSPSMTIGALLSPALATPAAPTAARAPLRTAPCALGLTGST